MPVLDNGCCAPPQKMSSATSTSLMDEYEYVMHGRVFKYVDR